MKRLFKLTAEIIGRILSYLFPQTFQTYLEAFKAYVYTGKQKRHFAKFGNNSLLSDSVRITNPQYISIGSDCEFFRGVKITATDSYFGNHYNPTLHIGDNCQFGEGSHITAINSIRIGNHVNIQDGSVLHTLYEKSTITIGDYVSVGHNVTIHGADVHDYALIGMGSTLLDGVVVGEGAIVAAGSLVLKNTQIGPYEVWGGVPAKFIKKADPEQTNEINRKIAHNYAMYASWYMEDEK